MIAEESTAWPMVTRPPEIGGLGFSYKWNLGWMHDTLHYFARDPVHRKFHQNDLTFGLLYAFHENFILPLSHDEVVHGKGSIFGRMAGDLWQKFANLRAYYAFMFTQPGKKLLFMGDEFAQSAEWNHDTSLDWHLLQYPEHRGVQTLVRDLNRLYRARKELHELDCDGDGLCLDRLQRQRSERDLVHPSRTRSRALPGRRLQFHAQSCAPAIGSACRSQDPTAKCSTPILRTTPEAMSAMPERSRPTARRCTATTSLSS